MKIRQKLANKIKEDTGYVVDATADLYRPTLTWSHQSAGRMKWYWYIDGFCIGSAENMTKLLKCPKIEMDTSNFGFVQFYSS